MGFVHEARFDCGIVCGQNAAVRGCRNVVGPRSIMPPPHAAKCRNLTGLSNNNRGQASEPRNSMHRSETMFKLLSTHKLGKVRSAFTLRPLLVPRH